MVLLWILKKIKKNYEVTPVPEVSVYRFCAEIADTEEVNKNIINVSKTFIFIF